jgi:hypothetical protein
VGVDGHRVGVLDAIEQRPQPRSETDRAGPRGVDVKVQAGVLAQVCHLGQRVDDARRGAARGRHYEKRAPAGGAVTGDR